MINNKSKKIAFVSDAIMPYNKGGKEKRLYEISKRLVNDACEVHIYTMKWWNGPRTIKKEGVYYHAISRLHPLYKNNRRSKTQAILFGLAVFKLMFEKFDVLDVDSIPFFPLFSARVVAWCKGKKLYVTWHEVWGQKYWMEYLNGVTGFFGFVIEKIALTTPDIIISNSNHTTKRLRSAGFKGKIETISLGVDFKNVYAAKPSENNSDIIFIGRLLSHKNVDILIKAVAIVKNSIPHIKCKIIGNGPERLKLVQVVNKLKLQENIEMIKNIEKHSSLYGLMKASKMLVLPSAREGFGLVVVEANACGLPVVTINHPQNAARDLICEGVNGFIAELSEKNIAKKILKIIQIREAMNPKKGIEKYDWCVIMGNIKKIFAAV